LGSALVLLMSVTISEPLEFSTFAPALLIATLFRLALDVSATRMILTQGHLPGGVGSIIPAFGQFVVRGNLVVGLIVFAILVTIQFIVIAQGSQRIAEVAARFTLDAMPGKQMAIDAEVHAGILDVDSARTKRSLVQQEADFYGAMDGAGKFIKGDAIAALVIVILNIAGGLAVGIFYHGLSPAEALNTFAILSIGNALVTTLPAFLMSISMGMMVTRVSAEGSLGFDLSTQIFARPDLLRAAAVLVFVLALVPGLPRPMFMVLAACAMIAAHLIARNRSLNARTQIETQERARRSAIRRPEMALSLIGVDGVCVEFGAGLTQLLTRPASEQLLDRIGEVRRAIAADIGIVLPGVRLRDNPAGNANMYIIRVRDRRVADGTLRLDALLAVCEHAHIANIEGWETFEPVYGLPAKWIESTDRDKAVAAGALVFDPISVLGSHLAEVAREHASALVGRQELQTLLEHLRSFVPALVKEVATDALPLSTVHRVYTLLLQERIWPRDPVATLEAIVDASLQSRDPRDIAERTRAVLVPSLLRRSETTSLDALIFAPALERELSDAWLPSGDSPRAAPDPSLAIRLRDYASHFARSVQRERAAAVCGGHLRPMLADFLLRAGISLPVFSYAELPSNLEIVPRAIFGGEAALTA
ncbi:MAG: FHIPEP family type III secretion protein, partial [Candidatus Eremiobacteraeota bacterium]|nr:FHIPEP family type III secretion protein [Candidatus Eremiobacteraeota bacterium]